LGSASEIPRRHCPSFEHQSEQALPLIEDSDKKVRLILGDAFGERAPVKTFSEMFYADVVLAANGKLPLPDNHEDRAVYVLEGDVTVAGDRFQAGQMMVFRPGDAITLQAGERGAHLMALGGETFSEDRYISWNFVSSSQEKIAQAEAEWRRGDWQNGQFTLPPGDDQEFIPLD